jgi:cytochrome c
MVRVVFASVALLLGMDICHAADDPGAKLFKGHCGTCHTLANDGSKKQGPNLFGVLTRKAGMQADYTKYSDGLKATGWQWTAEQLDLWLTDPKALVPTTYMSVYKQKDPEKRRLIIDYVKANGGM